MSRPHGGAAQQTCFMGEKNAGNNIKRRYNTGIVIYVNRDPTMWYYNRKNTVEASTFGLKFVALKTEMEFIKIMGYKLRIIGYLYMEKLGCTMKNELVVNNYAITEYKLKNIYIYMLSLSEERIYGWNN